MSDLLERIGGLAPYYAADGCAIYRCDNREIFAVIGDGGVDHVITDPPYDARTHVGAASLAGGAPGRYAIPFADAEGREAAIAAVCLRAARRWAIAFCTAEQLGAYRDGAGDAWVRAGAWVKTNPTPQFTGDRPAAWGDAIAIMHRAGKKRWNGGGKAALWRYGSARGADRCGHPTPKPLALMNELVAAFTDPGEVILDPFCGGGTTLLAALAGGRRAVGIEIDERYAEIAAKRLDEFSKQKTLQL